MNIKSSRAHELARLAAERTGRSQTSVVEEALQRFLAELDREQVVDLDRVDRVLAAVDARITDEVRAALLGEDLYDASGLPR